MVKTKAVLGLEYIDEKTATLAKDPDDTLRVFPSLNPNKRFEVGIRAHILQFYLFSVLQSNVLTKLCFSCSK